MFLPLGAGVFDPVDDHRRERERRGRRRARGVAHVQRALGLGEQEVVDELAVLADRLGADAGRAVLALDVARAAARARRPGRPRRTRVWLVAMRSSLRPVFQKRRMTFHVPGQPSASLTSRGRTVRSLYASRAPTSSAVGPSHTSPLMCRVRWTPRNGSSGSGHRVDQALDEVLRRRA